MYTISEERRALPCIYSNLNADEKLALCNGCGSKGAWLDIPDYIWTEECNEHDFDYWLGGDKTDRLSADVRFHTRMLEAIRRVAWVRWPYLRFAATRFYYGVRWGGEDAFYFGPRRGWVDVELFMRYREKMLNGED